MFLFREVCMKTRILTIAPYQGLKEMINEAISDRDDLEMTIRIGDLANGLEIVRSYDLDDFDMDLGDDLAGVDLDDTDNAPDDNE